MARTACHAVSRKLRASQIPVGPARTRWGRWLELSAVSFSSQTYDIFTTYFENEQSKQQNQYKTNKEHCAVALVTAECQWMA